MCVRVIYASSREHRLLWQRRFCMTQTSQSLDRQLIMGSIRRSKTKRRTRWAFRMAFQVKTADRNLLPTEILTKSRQTLRPRSTFLSTNQQRHPRTSPDWVSGTALNAPGGLRQSTTSLRIERAKSIKEGSSFWQCVHKSLRMLTVHTQSPGSEGRGTLPESCRGCSGTDH